MPAVGRRHLRASTRDAGPAQTRLPKGYHHVVSPIGPRGHRLDLVGARASGAPVSASIFIIARSENAKTGDVPTVWVGVTRGESLASCAGCAQLAARNCYSQFGKPAMAHANAIKSRGACGSFEVVAPILDRHPDARMLRVSAIGDPARANRAQLALALDTARAEGLAIVGYTHFAHEAPHLRGVLMASVDSFEAARDPALAGWRKAIVAPRGTTGTVRRADGGIAAVECPAIAAERMGKRFTCNDCASGKRGALCDASRPGPDVYFADHGPRNRRLPLAV